MEAQVRQQQIQRETTLQQQQLATQQAYHQAQIGLRSQALEQANQVNQFKMQNAARSMAANRGFEQAVQGGLPIEQALLKFPGANPSTVIAAHKADTDTAGASLALRQQEFQERQAKDAKGRGLTETMTTGGEAGDTTRYSGPPEAFNDMAAARENEIFGNLKPNGAAPNAAPAAPSQGAPPAAPAFNAPGDVVAAYKAGKLSRADAKKLLTSQFGVKE
jgi:hypothetical protein